MISPDAETKAYKGYDVDTTGLASPFAMAFTNNTWVLDYNLKMGGKAFRYRTTVFEITQNACSVKQELSTGGAWAVSGVVKGRRIAP